jgi:hypothetical protein
MSIILEQSRSVVNHYYKAAESRYRFECLQKDPQSSEQYIYPNQREDASFITDIFYNNRTKENKIRVVSIIKRTKVGMDGLMIEIATKMSTHPDDAFCLLHTNIQLITGMSNLSWETEMKNKMPECYKKNIYHHGKLPQLKKNIKNVKDTLFIVDEIDTGDKEDQRLHNILKDSGVLDTKYMDENNILFVFVSATMKNELNELYKWGNKHKTYVMTVPETYIGHKEFLEHNIIKEFYNVNDKESATRWIEEDIIAYYGSEHRVHIIRTNKKNVDFIRDACIEKGIKYKNHTSTDRISYEDLNDIFENTNLLNHLVVIIKGFWRRANLIKNEWKMKIGATHEMYTKNPDENVQVQGLPGRMSGYWRNKLIDDNGSRTAFKTGPYRTSIIAIESYEEFYKKISTGEEPEAQIDIQQNRLFLNPKNIKNLIETRNNKTKSEEELKKEEEDKKTEQELQQAQEADKKAKKVEKELKKAEKELKKESEDKCKRIPFVIDDLSEHDMNVLTINKKERKDYLIKKINNENLVNFMKTNDCIQFTHPKEDNSYKKHILDLIKASLAGNKFIVDLKAEDKKQNNWQAFIDSREKRVCIAIWCVDASY